MLVGQIVLLALKLSVLFSVLTQILLLRVYTDTLAVIRLMFVVRQSHLAKIVTIANDLGQLISYL